MLFSYFYSPKQDFGGEVKDGGIKEFQLYG